MPEVTADRGNADATGAASTLSLWAARLLAIRKQWHLMALSLLAGLLAAVLYLGYATRYYRSQATLLVQRESSQSGSSASIEVQEMYRTEFLRTQIEMVRDPDTLAVAYDNIQTALQAKGLTPEAIQQMLPAESWAGDLTVKALPNALIFRIEFEHPDRDTATLAVREVVSAFVSKERKNRKDRVERDTESQIAARDAAYTEMTAASAALERFQIQYKLVDPNISSSIVRKKFDDLANRRNDLLARMDQARALYDQCQAIALSTAADDELLNSYARLDFGEKSTLVRSLELTLLAEQGRLTELTFENGPRHWAVVQQQSKIAALNQIRLDEYRRLSGWVIDSWRADRETLERYQNELSELQQQSLEYQTAITQFQAIQKDLENKVEYYTRMKEELASLQNQLNSSSQSVAQQGNVYPWPHPVRPSIPITLAIALGLAVTLGVGLSLTAEYLDDSIKHPEELYARTGFTALGLIPHVPESFLANDKINYLHRFPQTSFSESIRSLRVNLIISLSARDVTNAVLAVTSSIPREGKSLVTSNLATAFAQTGKRTLLLQADLRRPTAAEEYGLKQADIAQRGTSAALSGQTPYEQCVHPVQGQMFIMPCGTCPPNPSELIGSKMKHLVDWARKHFDIVVIDTPPLINVSDTLLITPLCDGVLMVIHGGSTSGKLVQRTHEMLTRSTAPVLGAVLNDVTNAVARHHRFAERYGIGMYSYYSHYYTKYGYSSDQEVDHQPTADSGSGKAMD